MPRESVQTSRCLARGGWDYGSSTADVVPNIEALAAEGFHPDSSVGRGV